MTTNFFFHPYHLLLCLDPGSGMGKNQDPGSGINIPDSQHCCKLMFAIWQGMSLRDEQELLAAFKESEVKLLDQLPTELR